LSWATRLTGKESGGWQDERLALPLPGPYFNHTLAYVYSTGTFDKFLIRLAHDHATFKGTLFFLQYWQKSSQDKAGGSGASSSETLSPMSPPSQPGGIRECHQCQNVTA